jgi:hypothetical protein
MKKFITSIFLILSLVATGLMGVTPSVNAINKSAVRCDFIGQYINSASTGSPCTPCPENNYCPLVSGTQIENCAAKGYPATDCAETRVIFSTDKATPCPAGTSTRGFTFNTLRGTRITAEGDLFPVGQGATDISMCNAPEFKCTAPTPVLIKGVDGKAKCMPANTCSADQVPILKDGVPDCSVACKSNTLVGGKCYQDCAEGEYLEVISTSVNGVATQTVLCKKITVTPTVCPIVGQVPTKPGDVTTCACVAPQTLNTTVTPNKCETPVVPCKAPQTGNEPNCVNPITPCPANQYGYNVPNCKPCPNNGTSPVGTVDSSGCVVPVTPVAPTPPQDNGGGFNWGLLAAGLGVAVLGDCLLTKFFCNKPGTPGPTGPNNPGNPGNPTTPGKTTYKGTQYDIIKKTNSVSSTCSGSNESLVQQVYAVPGSHKESNGNRFFWVETNVVNGKTSSMSTIRSKEGVEVPALKCLMSRFYKQNSGVQGITFGNSVYMKELSRRRILHGLNKDKKSPGYLKECIDLDKLLATLGSYGEQEVKQSSVQYAVAVRGSKTPVSPWFNSIEEVKAWYSDSGTSTPTRTPSTTSTPPADRLIKSDFTGDIASNPSNGYEQYISYNPDDYTAPVDNSGFEVDTNSGDNFNDFFIGSINSVFGSVKASAQSDEESGIKDENSILFENNQVVGEEIAMAIGEDGEVIEVEGSLDDIVYEEEGGWLDDFADFAGFDGTIGSNEWTNWNPTEEASSNDEFVIDWDKAATYQEDNTFNFPTFGDVWSTWNPTEEAPVNDVAINWDAAATYQEDNTFNFNQNNQSTNIVYGDGAIDNSSPFANDFKFEETSPALNYQEPTISPSTEFGIELGDL